MTSEADGFRRASKRRGKRGLLTASAIAVVVAVAAVGTAAALHHPRSSAPTARSPEVTVVSVVRSDLSDGQTLSGTLGFGAAVPIAGHGTGTVTELASVGSTVTRGHTLFRADDQPVVLFYGGTPLYRDLSATPRAAENETAARAGSGGVPPVGTDGGQSTPDAAADTGPDGRPTPAAPAGDSPAPEGPPHGRDVTIVADNLVALGYDIGHRVTENGQAVYTPALSAAVKRWQKQVGMDETGVLGPSQIVVLPAAVRVKSQQARLGDVVNTPLMSVTPTTKTVTVPVAPSIAEGITAGMRVTIVLPDNKEIPGKVASVSHTVTPGAQSESGDSAPPTLIVDVRPLDGDGVAAYESAPVQVRFTTETRRGVLVVPVTALTAVRQGGYALLRTDGTLMPVTTGLFADGKVEVSGSGIVPGLRVEASQ